MLKSVPGSCYRKLESAERRLVGAITHAEPRVRLVAIAERVRRAQLGVTKALTRAASVPTELDDSQRAHQLVNLDEAAGSWEEMSVDDIIARYAAARVASEVSG